MISKEEYVELYCNELMYITTGVVVIDADKFHDRLIADPLKTIEDLTDYGMGEAMNQNGIEKITSLNTRTGKSASYSSPLDFDPDKFDWGSEDSIG
jgi:hypothetical protein